VRVTRERLGPPIASTTSRTRWGALVARDSTGEAPWYVVEGADERYRNLTVGKILLDAMQPLIKAPPGSRKAPLKHPVVPTPPSVLDNVKLIPPTLDLSKRLPREDYNAIWKSIRASSQNCRATSALPAIR